MGKISGGMAKLAKARKREFTASSRGSHLAVEKLTCQRTAHPVIKAQPDWCVVEQEPRW